MSGMLRKLFGLKPCPGGRDLRDLRMGVAADGALDATLARFSDRDAWTVADALTHVLILGGSGGGKTSGSGQLLALSYLAAGFGFVILCVKPEERSLWEKYARMVGRSDDVIVFGPNSPWRFDPLDFEVKRQGAGAGLTENIVSLLASLLEAAEKNGGGGREDEGYWKRALRQLLRNLVDLIVIAEGRVTVPDLYRLAVSAPTSMDQVRSPEWRAHSFCFQCLAKADASPKTARQKNDFPIVADYFLLEFPGLSDKTRSVIVSTFTSMVDVLNRGLLKELFCGGTNIDPTATERGKILIIDVPVKEFGDVGLYSQIIWKFAFQKSIERRDVSQSPLPVVLWQDEGQVTLASYDPLFLTTCRSARVANVFLTQSVSNVHAALGGKSSGEAEANSLLGNFALKILHANGDGVTNDWAANLIGRSRQFVVNASNSTGGDGGDDAWSLLTGGGPSHGSAGVSEVFEHECSSQEFTKLRTGGPANGYAVDAILFSSNRRFQATGRPWMRCTFSQQS